MDMKKMVAVAMVFVLVATVWAAGCAQKNTGTSSKPKLEPVTEQIPPKSGWISSPDAAEPTEFEHTETIQIPSPYVTAFTVTVSIQDSDEEHSETDEGSDPDIVTVTVSDGANITEKKDVTSGTSYTFSFSASGEDGDFLGQTWTINFKGKEFGGGKPAYFFGFIVYIDQGAEWSIDSGSYTYLSPGGEPLGGGTATAAGNSTA